MSASGERLLVFLGVLVAAGALVWAGGRYVFHWWGPPPVREGVVIRKKHEGPSTFVAVVPIRTGQVCSSSGKTTTCTPIYSYFPFVFFDDEDWKVTVRNEEGRTGTLYVDAGAFAAIKVGQWYGNKTADTDDPNKRGERA